MYKEIQKGAVAKSYMRKGFLICEEMRKYLVIYEGAFSQIWLCNCFLLNFLMYIWENFILFFISAVTFSVQELIALSSLKGSEHPTVHW